MRGSIRATSEKVLETIGRRPFLRLVHQVLISGSARGGCIQTHKTCRSQWSYWVDRPRKTQAGTCQRLARGLHIHVRVCSAYSSRSRGVTSGGGRRMMGGEWLQDVGTCTLPRRNAYELAASAISRNAS